MNYSNQRPGLKARAAHISLAAASAAALLTSGVAIVTAMPAQAAIENVMRRGAVKKIMGIPDEKCYQLLLAVITQWDG